MKAKLLCLAAALALGGCASQPPVVTSATAALSDAQLFAEARRVVLDGLKDPDSAKFGEFWRLGDVACGTVNSKNSMGGYTGKKIFAVKDGHAQLQGEGDSFRADFFQALIPCISSESEQRVMTGKR
jgi:hypothetical protein